MDQGTTTRSPTQRKIDQAFEAGQREVRGELEGRLRVIETMTSIAQVRKYISDYFDPE